MYCKISFEFYFLLLKFYDFNMYNIQIFICFCSEVGYWNLEVEDASNEIGILKLPEFSFC